MKNLYLLVTVLVLVVFTAKPMLAQEKNNQIWSETSPANLSKTDLVHRKSQPKNFKLYSVNIDILKEKLNQAPSRITARGVSNTIIQFPNSEGKLERFRVFNSPIMHPLLAAKYPMIKTYAAQGIDDPTATMRFSITQFGLHAMSLSGKRSAVYIDPYDTDRVYYMVYNRSALAESDNLIDFECLTDEGYHVDMNRSSETNRNDTDDQKLRKYRLAQSCTAEYGNIFAGTGTDAEKKANIQAQMTITINRVNEIYERDLAITLEFIANNDLLIYYGNTSADPWTSEWNTTTQTTIDNTIGDANYDIGHNFNTTGGGNAGCIACVCSTGQKGSGFTGRSDPTGDAFDIDYVAHEMGHQFGGYHTMNTCSRSGNGMTEVEPASGSSIMGYAGICSTNVQMHSDAHFNYVNIRDISANVQPGGNSTCSVNTDLTNNPPTADAGADYTIPQGTAFVLEGTATDSDGMESLTYNWSQNDPEQAPGSGTPQSTWTVGPLYRAKLPIDSPKRYMPQFSDVLAGNLSPTWEMTPTVSRNMEFSFIVRDNDISGGQTAADLMNVTVDGNSGPFAVTSQTATETWDAGTNQTITWDVAGTNVAPVNATTVDILLTSDGGETFVTAASNVPNNGSYTINVPSGATTNTARVMVRGHNNIFYAINSANLSIQDSEFVMSFAETSLDLCVPSDAVYTLTYNTFNGFSETTTFSATGNPAGSTVVFSPAQVTADGTAVTMTVSGITSAMLGQYTINVVGTATSVTKDVNVTLGVYDDNFSTINLTAPTDTATGILTPVTLEWDLVPNAQEYTVEVATDASFTNIIESATVGNNMYSTGSLGTNTEYFWRVKASNICGEGNFSTTFSFTTANIACDTYTANDNPQDIGPDAGTVTTSMISVPDDLMITDVNVTIDLTHTYDGDLDITLMAPDGTQIDLSSGNGSFDDNYTNTTFDDDAATSISDGSAPFTGSFQPEEPLSTFNDLSSLGDWTLTITDNANGDAGELLNWSLNICGGVTVGVNDFLVNNLVKLYPNPTNGILKINNQENIKLSVYDILGKQLFTNSFEVGSNQIDLTQYESGVYFVRVSLQDNSQQATKTYKIIKN